MYTEAEIKEMYLNTTDGSRRPQTNYTNSTFTTFFKEAFDLIAEMPEVR